MLTCFSSDRYVGMLLWVVGCPAVGVSTLKARDSTGSSSRRLHGDNAAPIVHQTISSGSRTQLLDGATISFGQFKKVVARFGPLDRNFLGTLYENLIRCVLVGH